MPARPMSRSHSPTPKTELQASQVPKAQKDPKDGAFLGACDWGSLTYRSLRGESEAGLSRSLVVAPNSGCCLFTSFRDFSLWSSRSSSRPFLDSSCSFLSARWRQDPVSHKERSTRVSFRRLLELLRRQLSITQSR